MRGRTPEKGLTVVASAAVALATVLTMTGCAQTIDLASIDQQVTALSKNVNEAKTWTDPGATPTLGLRLFVGSTKPADVARSIESIAPTLLKEIPGSYMVTITVVPGSNSDYSDYFAVKNATTTSMREVSGLLKLTPAGKSELDLSAGDLRRLAGE